MKQELETEKRQMREENQCLQEELGHAKFLNEVQESKIREIIKDQNDLIEDFKSLGLENKKLKDKLKGKPGHSRKKLNWQKKK